MKKLKNQSDMPDTKFIMFLWLITNQKTGDVVLTNNSYQKTSGQNAHIIINRGFITEAKYFPLGAFKGYFGQVKDCTFRKVPAHFWESIWGLPTNVI